MEQIHEKKAAPKRPSSTALDVGDGTARIDDRPESLEPRSERPLEALPKARTWLVDGYNVLHCAPFRRTSTDLDETRGKPFWSATMRERLVAVARCFPDRDAEIWLVFDGTRAPEDAERGAQPRVTLQFAASADDWIVRRVRDAEQARDVVVVSGDRRLTGRTRHYGAAVVSPRHFLHHCFASQSSTEASVAP